MEYTEYEIAFSPARFNKYLYACNGNQSKALQLYRYNIQLCQKFYGLLNVFEVVLRNAIDNHYKSQLSDNDWIRTQLGTGGLLNYAPQRDKTQEFINKLIGSQSYTNDRVVSGVSFGFWPYLFTKKPYKLGGQNLLQIFPNRSKGVNQRKVYNDLQEIKNFRNRIAHHEPICFNASGDLDLSGASNQFNLLNTYISYLGYSRADLCQDMDIMPDQVITKMKQL